jgi:hypothetical protein
VAQALYCTASLLNHACAPVAHASFARGGALVLRCAAASLAPHAPLSIAYGPQTGEAPRAQRRRLLRTSHAFVCACAACEGTPSAAAAEMQMVGLRCLASATCDGALPLPPAKEREREGAAAAVTPPPRCSVCGDAPGAAALASAAARARAAKAALPAARDARNTHALASLLAELRATAHARNRRVAEAEDALAEALHASGDGDAAGALAHARAGHAILAAHYPAGSLALAHERAKLAALAAAAGEGEADAAARDAADACAAFRAHYGEGYPRLAELAPLLRPQCEA